MKQFFKTINTDEVFYQSETTIGNWALGGRIRSLASPMMWFYNGCTYALGYESNVYSNQVHIVKQDKFTLTSATVGSGTTSPEPANHPAPAIYIDETTGYIYVVQCKYHEDSYNVWKSDSPEDISSFTKTGEFDTDGSYLALLRWSGSETVWTVRGSDYSHHVVTVDLDTPAGYVDTKVVDMVFATNQVRAYPVCINYYGTPTKRLTAQESVNESNGVGYKISFMFTDDEETFDNLDITRSTDVTSAAITFADLDTYFAIVGSDSDKTTSISPAQVIQINDDVYLAYKSASDTMTINKYTYGSSGVQATFDMPYTYTIAGQEDGYTYLYYDGTRIVGTTKIDDDTCYLFSIATDLTDYKLERTLDVQDGAYFGIPWNMQDVTGLYLMIGRSNLDTGAGYVPYIVTDQRF